MKKIFTDFTSRLLLLVLTLTVLLSSLSSCNLFAYVADEKGEIIENVEDGSENTLYTHVSQYLRDWGFPLFNQTKFNYMESKFQTYYNFGDGLPDIYTHAKETANLYLEYYYDDPNVKSEDEVTNALLYCYVKVIGDPYSVYRPPVQASDYSDDINGEFGGIGVVVQYNTEEQTIMIETVYPDSPADKAGIKVGDYIYSVDGKTISDVGLEKVVNNVRGKIGTQVEIVVIRDGKHITTNPIRDKIVETSVTYSVNHENKTGYIKVSAFKGNTFSQFKEAIDSITNAGVKGIVFDMRGNLGGLVQSVVDIVSYLIPDGKVVITYQYKGNKQTVLYSDDAGNDDHVVNLPFVILCDEQTASSAEIFTSVIRDYRNMGDLNATIVGTTTYKKGIMQNSYTYPFDGSTVTMTVAYYNPPCGVNYHGIGVNPDVFVENENGKDLQLEVGYEELLKLINAN